VTKLVNTQNLEDKNIVFDYDKLAESQNTIVK